MPACCLTSRLSNVVVTLACWPMLELEHAAQGVSVSVPRVSLPALVLSGGAVGRSAAAGAAAVAALCVILRRARQQQFVCTCRWPPLLICSSRIYTAAQRRHCQLRRWLCSSSHLYNVLFALTVAAFCAHSCLVLVCVRARVPVCVVGVANCPCMAAIAQ